MTGEGFKIGRPSGACHICNMPPVEREERNRPLDEIEVDEWRGAGALTVETTSLIRPTNTHRSVFATFHDNFAKRKGDSCRLARIISCGNLSKTCVDAPVLLSLLDG
jgi:hypothetical protein